MPQVHIRLTTGKVFNGNMKKPGTVLLKGETPNGIELHKILNAIRLGETEMVVVETKDEGKSKK